MRSETPPMWSTYLVALGILLLFAAIFSLAKGEIKLTRSSFVSRAERPEAFWAIIGGCFLVAIISLAVAIPHFGPGG